MRLALAVIVVGLGLPAQANASQSGSGLLFASGLAREGPGPGSVGIQLLDAPAARAGDPRAQRYIVDHLHPGTTIERHILVTNETDRSQQVAFYPAAATLEGGRFVFGADRTPNELTSWISLEKTILDLKPWNDVRVTVRIQVPANASAGERYAVVWAAIASASEANVAQVHRVGVRVYLDIGPGGEPPSSFRLGGITAAHDKHGQPSATIEVFNTGGRAVDLSGRATLSEGPGGLQAGPFTVVDGLTLAPGKAGVVRVLFPPELPNGPWTIEFNLESGWVRESARARLTFPEAGGVGATAALGSGPRSPWRRVGLVLAVGLPVLGVLAVTMRRAWRRSASRDRGSVNPLFRRHSWHRAAHHGARRRRRSGGR